jgi:HK97 family phage major capsid protein
MLPVEKASGIGINSQGGVLVPNLMSDRIITLRQASGIMRQFASNWPITQGDEMTVPRRTTGVTVSFLAENATLASNDLAFDAVTLHPKKLGGFVRLSSEVSMDSIIPWTEYLMEDFASALALVEDDCGLNATGTSSYAGMQGICPTLIDGTHTAGAVAAASGSKTALTITTADLAALMWALPEQYWPAARFYMSGYFYGCGIARLVGATGGNVETGAGLSYAGVPISLTPKMAGSGDQPGKVMILLGDMSKCMAFGSGREITAATSTQRYMDMDQLACRVTERIDLVPHSLGDDSSAGPIVGLVGTG